MLATPIVCGLGWQNNHSLASKSEPHAEIFARCHPRRVDSSDRYSFGAKCNSRRGSVLGTQVRRATVWSCPQLLCRRGNVDSGRAGLAVEEPDQPPVILNYMHLENYVFRLWRGQCLTRNIPPAKPRPDKTHGHP